MCEQKNVTVNTLYSIFWILCPEIFPPPPPTWPRQPSFLKASLIVLDNLIYQDVILARVAIFSKHMRQLENAALDV